VDRYPLYIGADEALYLLGQSYEAQIANLRASKMQEAAKAKVIQEFTRDAGAAYSKIISRYPMMGRADDAKKRLLALRQPVPTPTQAAIAQNQKEEDSRRSSGMVGRLMGNFSRHPDVAQATKVGDPTLVDPKPVSATDVVAAANRAIFTKPGNASDNKVSVETVKEGAPPPNEAAPRSDAPTPPTAGTSNSPLDSTATTDVETVPANEATVPASTGAGAAPAGTAAGSDANSGIGELKPNVPPDAQTPPPPAQVNEIEQNAKTPESGNANASTSSSTNNAASSGDTSATNNDSQGVSSSKKKKKKHKLFF
jgi:outer membrane protein assembly factor BamD